MFRERVREALFVSGGPLGDAVFSQFVAMAWEHFSNEFQEFGRQPPSYLVDRQVLEARYSVSFWSALWHTHFARDTVEKPATPGSTQDFIDLFARVDRIRKELSGGTAS